MKKGFEIAVLASGSKGNTTLIKAGDTAILIDAGISCQKIVKGLAQFSLRPEDLSGILLTHEHSDHVNGLPVFSKKFKLPIFANEPTWQAMELRNRIDRDCPRLLPGCFTLGDLRIESFPVSHDAAAPVGYSLCYGESKCTYVTDSGFVNETTKRAAVNSDILIVEANHDEELLKNGIYPRVIKERILGIRGHLSNSAAGWFIANLAKLPSEVFLAHLSEENNRPELALTTIEEIVNASGREKLPKFYIASQNTVVHNWDKE